MSVGYPITKADLDNTMGALVVNLRDALTAIVQFKVLLDDSTILTDSFLTGLGYTSPEVTQLRAAFADLKKLNDIAANAATQSPSNDFWFNAKHLVGLNFH